MKKEIILLTVFLFALACSRDVDYSPREINWDRDICEVCLMGLAEKKYSVQAINDKGKVIWFDDLGCLVEFFDSPDWERFKGEKTKIWIGNCETGEWINAREAHYRFGDKTPMGYGYGALSEPNDSTYTFEETVERIRQGKTNRKEFLEKKKMDVSNN